MATIPATDRIGFRHLYPFDGRFFQLGRYRMHYLDEGAGHPVVMLHGNPTWSFYYRRLVLGLRGTHRAIVPDHLGCGLSDRPRETEYSFRLDQRVADLTALLDHLVPDSAMTLVVHDWGGMIGMRYALAHPGRIHRLVILNTAGFFPPGGMRLPLRLALLRHLPGLAKPAIQGLNLFVRGAAAMGTVHRLAPDVLAGLTAPYDTWDRRLAVRKFVEDIPTRPGHPTYEAVQYVDAHLHELARIPMLICWGATDFVFDRDYFAEWRHRFPDAEAHMYEDAGHYVLEDRPEAILERVRDFFDRHPAPSPD